MATFSAFFVLLSLLLNKNKDNGVIQKYKL